MAFTSSANNLLEEEDTNSARDVFVHDHLTVQTIRASVASGGVQVTGHSGASDMSADGRYVAFSSRSRDLVPDKTNDLLDVFVYDRIALLTERVSVDATGGEANGDSSDGDISGDGRMIAFTSYANNLVAIPSGPFSNIYVKDRLAETVEMASVSPESEAGNWTSNTGSISTDGRFVAFNSQSSNLITGDTNSEADIFVRDRLIGETTRVSVDSTGTQGSGPNYLGGTCAVSADGQFVAFSSNFTNLVRNDLNGDKDVFIRDTLPCATGDGARAGLVDTGDGSTPANVLYVDGSPGDSCREIFVTAVATTTLTVDKAPSVATKGHYFLWIYDGEPGPPDVAETHVVTGKGVLYNLGLGARALPFNNSEVPGSVPCPVTFPVGRTSKSLGAGTAAILCLHKKPGFAKAPVVFTQSFPAGSFVLGVVVQDLNATNSPAKNLSIGNWVVVHAQ